MLPPRLQRAAQDLKPLLRLQLLLPLPPRLLLGSAETLRHQSSPAGRPEGCRRRSSWGSLLPPLATWVLLLLLRALERPLLEMRFGAAAVVP